MHGYRLQVLEVFNSSGMARACVRLLTGRSVDDHLAEMAATTMFREAVVTMADAPPVGHSIFVTLARFLLRVAERAHLSNHVVTRLIMLSSPRYTAVACSGMPPYTLHRRYLQAPDRGGDTIFFWGNPGAMVYPLHYDNHDDYNFQMVLRGCKKAVLLRDTHPLADRRDEDARHFAVDVFDLDGSCPRLRASLECCGWATPWSGKACAGPTRSSTAVPLRSVTRMCPGRRQASTLLPGRRPPPVGPTNCRYHLHSQIKRAPQKGRHGYTYAKPTTGHVAAVVHVFYNV